MRASKSAHWDRVNELFRAARNLSKAGRAALIDRARAESPAIARQLEELLSADVRSGTFVLDHPDEAPPALGAPFRTGQQVGPFRILSEIGRGGMGIVYLAEDTNLRGPVALKAMRPDLAASLEHRERLRREAEAARRLSHPVIATVYGFHVFDDVACIAYEYVEGETLRDQLRGGALPITDVAAIGADIADALSAAEAKGITHRDLKPENVIRTPDGRVKVLDFGLALLDPIEVHGRSADRLTRNAVIVGTPSYMAPEQLRQMPIDHRTDIFQLGTMLYELASGQHPFETDDTALTMARILVTDPRPLTVASAEFDRVIRKCLQKSPAERYQSARDLLIDLDRLRHGEEPRPAAVTASKRKKEVWRAWWRMHQVAVVMAYVVMVAVAGTGMRLRVFDSDAVFALIACAATVGTMARLHLLFQERMDSQTIHRRVERLRWVLRGCDSALTVALASASVMLLRAHGVVAAVLAAAAIAFGFTFTVIEPATTERAFARRGSSAALRRADAAKRT